MKSEVFMMYISLSSCAIVVPCVERAEGSMDVYLD
jgi:hypothetical protein